jgi:hypothetical protein
MKIIGLVYELHKVTKVIKQKRGSLTPELKKPQILWLGKIIPIIHIVQSTPKILFYF